MEPPHHAAEAEPLRWLLQCWAELVHSYALDYVGPDRPVLPKGIEDRDADVWEPLLAVAELAGGHWPERARVTAVAAVTADGVKTTPSHGIDCWPTSRRLRPTGGRSDLHQRTCWPSWPTWSSVGAGSDRKEAGPHAARLRDRPDQQGPRIGAKVTRATGGSTSRTPGRATCRRGYNGYRG